MESKTINERAKIYRLPTEDITDVVVNTYINDAHDKSPVLTFKEKALLYLDNVNSDITERGYQYQHLYFTTDEKTKVGDWMFWVAMNKIIKCTDNSMEDRQDMCRKIVASTDESLKIETELDAYYRNGIGGAKSLPQLAQSFVEEYCELGGIDTVLVEYEEYIVQPYFEDKKQYNDFRIKVDPHNTITIHLIKNSWTETELLGNQDGSLDHFLLHSSTYTQEEREVVMDAICGYLNQHQI